MSRILFLRTLRHKLGNADINEHLQLRMNKKEVDKIIDEVNQMSREKVPHKAPVRIAGFDITVDDSLNDEVMILESILYPQVLTNIWGK